MSTLSLPDHATLGTLRHEARRLQSAVREHRPEALDLLRGHGVVPDPADDSAHPEPLSLELAHEVVAREHGFADWAAARQWFTSIADLRWDDGPEPTDEPTEDRFCRLAAARFRADDGPRFRTARALLDADPALVDRSVWAAAAAFDLAAVERHLDRDPGLVVRRGGPQRWTPLYHLAYSRVPSEVSAAGVQELAQRLVDAGADPNEGYLWDGRPPPFTVVTGVLGEGEGGPDAPPEHRGGLALARLLLAAGADPNDGQALYNRMFRDDDGHLALLLEHGLGSGHGGPWRHRLGTAVDSPPELLQGQLQWAVDHGFVARVRLLVDHGTDLASPWNGRTPLAAALLAGETEIAAVLSAAGAPAPGLDEVDTLVAAAMAGDERAVATIRDGTPEVVARARRRRPGLVVWAAARHRPDAVRLLVSLGFDLNALGRGDTPVEQGWETALHHAAGDGDAALVRLLLDLGADATRRDRRFDATPADWARYFGHQDVAALL